MFETAVLFWLQEGTLLSREENSGISHNSSVSSLAREFFISQVSPDISNVVLADSIDFVCMVLSLLTFMIMHAYIYVVHRIHINATWRNLQALTPQGIGEALKSHTERISPCRKLFSSVSSALRVAPKQSTTSKEELTGGVMGQHNRMGLPQPSSKNRGSTRGRRKSSLMSSATQQSQAARLHQCKSMKSMSWRQSEPDAEGPG